MNTGDCGHKMFYQLFRPIIFLQDPEKAHERIIEFGKFLKENHLNNFLKPFFHYEDSRLNTTVCGIDFKNPVGLAAGFDKNAVLPEFIEMLGFGFEEIGSVTANGGDGNQKPRIFRLPKDKAIVNRMGLNNQGAYRINKNLKRRSSKIPVGFNIAKTHSTEILGEKAIEDFKISYMTMTEGSYAALNVSCPNTTEGKTFEDPIALAELLFEINIQRKYMDDRRPLFVKLSPDNWDKKALERMLYVCEGHNIDGYILANSSSKRDGLETPQIHLDKIGIGGLSGKPLQSKSNEIISFVYRETKKPIIGVGGIFNGDDAYNKIKAGATIVQGLTGLIYEGPGFAKKINKRLVRLLERDGLCNIQEAIGIDYTRHKI